MEYVDGASLDARIRQAGGMPAFAKILARLKGHVADLPRLSLSRLRRPHLQGAVASIEQYWHYYLIGLAALLLVVVAIAVRPSIRGGGSIGTETEAGPVHTVMIDITGAPADVYRNGQRLGLTPHSLKTPIGEHVELTLRRDGYYDETLVFDVTASMTGFTQSLRRKR